MTSFDTSFIQIEHAGYIQAFPIGENWGYFRGPDIPTIHRRKSLLYKA